MSKRSSCIVMGCRSTNSQANGIHFFNIPKDPIYRDVYRRFSRRGSDYVITDDTRICSYHFHPSCKLKKKKYCYLAQNAVPTIFKQGLKTVTVTFDYSVMFYLEEDTLLCSAYDRERNEMEIRAKRVDRLNEVESLCSFCLYEDETETKLVEVSTLREYSIQPSEIFELIGLKEYPIFKRSALICEECFESVVTFDGFRRRCCKAQNELVKELENFAMVIGQEQEMPMYPEEDSDDNISDVDPCPSTTKKRQHIVKDVSTFQNNDFKTEIKTETIFFSDFDEFPALLRPKLEIPEPEIVKLSTADTEADEYPGDNPGDSDNPDDDYVMNNSNESDEEQKADKKKLLDIYNPADHLSFISPSSVIKSKDQIQKSITKNVYECFLCQLKFAGRLSFKRHKCEVKDRGCPVGGCTKRFTKQCGYNAHTTKVHKLPKIAREFCSICKLSWIANGEEFQQHIRQCEARSDKKAAKSSVDCPLCGKTCTNTRALSVHMKFHDASYQSSLKDSKPNLKCDGPCVCEYCGKGFAKKRSLSDHVLLHKPQENPRTFICDFCGKTFINRKKFTKHLRTVHLAIPSPCSICGKVFKNKTLLTCHMVYHNESKRIHFCPQCPDKPAWWTAVALRRHQESNHGLGPGYHCERCGDHFRTNKSLSRHIKEVHLKQKRRLEAARIKIA